MNEKPTNQRSKYLILIKENIKQAKGYLEQGKISKEDLEKLIQADPTKQKKYVGWMAKSYINNHTDLDDLRNTVEEYNNFLNRGKAKTKDVNQFKSFKDMKDEVEELNNSGEAYSSKELENDYDTFYDDNNLLVCSPHTHEASRKLGLSKFAFRDCPEGKDSAWCTTYKSPDHFNDYYYNNDVHFYYIRVRSKKLIEKLQSEFPSRYKELEVVALAVLPNGTIDAYDGLDKQISSGDQKKYLNAINLSVK